MKKHLYYTAALLIASMGALTSCQDDYENVSDHNHVYDTAERVAQTLLDGKANDVTRTLSVEMAQPVGYEVNVTYAVDLDAVQAYNDIYSQNAIALPQENYSIPDPTATIEIGKVKSSEVEIVFTNLNDLDTDSEYVLPVSIVSSTVPALKSSSTTYFVFRGAALINVVGGTKGTCLRFVNEGQCPELANLTQMTFEVLVNPDAFDNMLSTLIGIEGVFLIRIGDASVPSNQIQLATSSGNVTDENWKLDIGKWTAIALTFDSATGAVDVYFNGVKKGATQTVGYRRAVNWNVVSSDRACYIGYAYDTNRDFQGKMSEMRIWNKILSPSDLTARNHFYNVNPDAEGLVAYWKFDEGSGNYIHDYANGYDMQVPATYPGKSSVPGNLEWTQVTLP